MAQVVMGTPRATPAQCPHARSPHRKRRLQAQEQGPQEQQSPHGVHLSVCGFSRLSRSPGRWSWPKVPEAWEVGIGRAALLGLLGHRLFVGSQAEQLP